MKTISIQGLKARLSTAVAEAEAGRSIVITRHNQPVAKLVSIGNHGVHRGSRVGAGGLRPALKQGTKGRALAALLDDRGNR